MTPPRLLGITLLVCLAALAGADVAQHQAPLATTPEGSTCRSSGVGPGDHERALSFDGQERRYLLHVPPGYRPGQPMPVVLNFHGGAGFPQAQVDLTSMNRTADREGFIVVYPFGSGILKSRFLTFNAGSCCGFARDRAVDDVELVRELVEDLSRVVCIDRRRVYATGHSNGGMLAHRLGCELADEIAAVASVAGPIGLTGCHPARPVPVLHIHGTADQCAPYEGGPGASRNAGKFRSVEETRRIWLSADGCSGDAETIYAKGSVRCLRWSRCAGDAEVVVCTVEGGGHAWPGAAEYPSERICGGTLVHDFDANSFIWDFFSRHSLPASPEPGPNVAKEALPPDRKGDRKKPPPP